MKYWLKEIQRSLVCFLIVGNVHISSAAMTVQTIKWPWNSSPIGAFGDATELPGLISGTEQSLRNSQKRQPSVENESKCCSLPSPRAPKPPTSRDMFLNWTDTLWWHHEEVMYSLGLRGETRPSIFASRDRTVFRAAQYSFILSDRCKFFSFSFFSGRHTNGLSALVVPDPMLPRSALCGKSGETVLSGVSGVHMVFGLWKDDLCYTAVQR